MSGQTFLQIITSGFAALGMWFTYDLIKEFKLFKTEANRDIAHLKLERENFKTTIKQTEFVIGSQVNSLQKLHNDFSNIVQKSLNEVNLELEKIKNSSGIIEQKSKYFEDFLNKLVKISKTLNDRIRKSEYEIENLKIQMGEILIFKEEKAGK